MTYRGRTLRLGSEFDGHRRSAHGYVDSAAPLERDVLPQVRDALRRHPAVSRVFRINSGAHFAGEGEDQRFIRYHDVVGMSDLWAWLKPPYAPVQAFVEVKRPGGSLSDNQAAFLEGCTAHGHIAFVATGPGEAWTKLQEFLRRIDASRN